MNPLPVTIVVLLLTVGVAQSSATSATATPIKHVVIVMQENHSFDNYFGVYPTANETYVNEITKQLEKVNGIPAGVCLRFWMDCISPYYAKEYNTTNPFEGRTIYEEDYNNSRMDGFATFSGPQSMAYFDYHQIAAYWDYAEEYGLADNYFSSALTTTTPNRLLLLSGDTPISQKYGPPPYEPYSQTILSQLSANGVSWGYFDYLNGADPSTFYPFNYISGLGQSAAANIQDMDTFFRNLSKRQGVPDVSFVNTLGRDYMDEHPPANVTVGELWVVSVINAIMQSDYWNSTAIFVTHDEGGGYYDHVPPPQQLKINHSFDRELHGYGHRVPLLVISPYAKENYVSKALLNHMSLARFIDYNWKMQPLNQNIANSGNLLDFFAFNSDPRPPIILRGDGRFSVSSYPIPLQFPLNQLPYSRSSATSSQEPLGNLQIPVFMLPVSIIAALILLTIALRTKRIKH